MPSPSPSARAVDPVRAVRADDDVDRDRLAVDRHALPLDRDLRPLAHLDPSLARRVEQERVEPPALRHADHRLLRAALDRVAVAEAELDDVDLFLDDRRRVDRALRARPASSSRRRRACRAGSVALSSEQHGRAALGEAVGGRRPGRPAADDEDVKTLHHVRLQSPSFKGVCPSGQRERAVNPSAQPTEVRILPPPFGLCRARQVEARRASWNRRRPADVERA